MADKNNPTYLRHFSHFAQRMIERYEIFITFDEYFEMCNSDFYLDRYVDDWAGRKIRHLAGYIPFQSRMIYVIKAGYTPAALLTALPFQRPVVKSKDTLKEYKNLKAIQIKSSTI
jgi:hypothetical protein